MSTGQDITAVVGQAFKQSAFANSGTLPPTRLKTLAAQLGDYLATHGDEHGAAALGKMLCQQGIGLRSLFAAMQAAQRHYIEQRKPEAALAVGRKMSALVESYVDQAIGKVRFEQERLRAALVRINQP